MTYPKMLIARNEPLGCIWQAYIIQTDIENRIIGNNMRRNGFFTEYQDVGYTDETFPNWRDSKEWKQTLASQ